ncbi:MAG: gfo/Idh/MocA family oxidoreductase [Wenzhouxiangella sp.]|nr:MAG: gfo/Idh/MocA family oxidoreductase [Wenzhouxiangella sp.]
MTNVKILGAGSIGNHLAHGARRLGWEVTLSDVDPAALERTRSDIYPSRYGSWDDAIRLAAPAELGNERFDVVILGTPPDTHIPLALAEIDRAPPRLMLIEKPLSPPDLGPCSELVAAATRAQVRVLVGYNHRLTRHTALAAEWLKDSPLGEATTLRAMTREHWGGIFAAHPWLAGPADSYLGFTARGGGALGEHSHAINIWQYFAELAGCGRIVEVACMLDEVRQDGAAYDRIAQLSVRTEHGLVGTIVQDVITRPAQKWLRLEGSEGYLEWQVSVDADHDLVRLVEHDGRVREERVAKTRPDDFRGELEHMNALLGQPQAPSPIDLDSGLETMRVIVAALRSAREGRTVRVER